MTLTPGKPRLIGLWMTEEISVQQIFIATIITRVKLRSASPYHCKKS
jgi:hypothetical protein